MNWKEIKEPTLYDLHRQLCDMQEHTEDDSKKAVLGEVLDMLHDVMVEEKRCLREG